MSDVLLELGRRPGARKLISSLGLPIPMPVELDRARSPRTERPLAAKPAAVSLGGGAVGAAIAATLAQAGATSWVHGDAAAAREAGEAWGTPPKTLDLDAVGDARFHGLVFDASTLAAPSDLERLYAFYHALVRKIGRGGRAVVVGRDPEGLPPAAAATQAALDGFVRSLAKEVGRKAATANLVYVATGAESRLAGPLRFLLTARSAYVSGQALRVGAEVAGDAPSTWVRPLDGKVVLVTGAARGIGAATAAVLAGEGAKVMCLDRPEDQAAAAELARNLGGVAVGVDITAPDAAAQILAAAPGPIRVVVHNAGITRDRTLAKMDAARWNSVIDVNLGAVARITQAMLDEDALAPGARIVCLSSISGIAGNAGQTNYGAAKSGVIGFVRAAAVELAARGVAINAIAPGFIETRMTDAMPAAIREVARRMNNLGQGGRPEDVAEAITFLATPGALGITGQTLRVCGGALVGR